MVLHAERRKRLPRAERERQILEVAEETFASVGYQAAAMDDIAARVGLSKPMLYEYFGSKEGLLLACLERARRELHESTAKAAEGADTPYDLLYACTLAFFRFSDEHARSWALLRNESALPSATVNTELEATREQQVAFTISMMRIARPDLGQTRLEVFAEAIIGACERLAHWRDRAPAEERISAEEATEHLLALIGPSLTP